MQIEIALDRGHSAARAAADKAEDYAPGWIEATGQYAPAASSNGAPKRLYRLKGMM